MNYKPPDLEQRKIVQAPNWLWPKGASWIYRASGKAHYYDEQGFCLCSIWCLGSGFEANESDAEHICQECLELLQTERFAV